LRAAPRDHAWAPGLPPIDPARGTLTPLKHYAMGKNPNWVEIVTLP